MKRTLLAGCALLAAAIAAPARAAPADAWHGLVEQFFRADWAAHPVRATQTGVHDFDARLDDLSAEAFAADVTRLHRAIDAMRAVDGATLPAIDRNDRDVLLASLDGRLLREETLRTWRRNPDEYVTLASYSLFALISRDFAPKPQRLAAVIAREKALPELFARAKLNLTDMAPVYVQIGLLNAAGAAHFIRESVPAAFADVTDQTLKQELAVSTRQAAAAAEDFATWLRGREKTASASFVWGRENLQRLLNSDLVTETPEAVLAAGRAQLARDKALVAAAAKAMGAASPEAAMAQVGQDHAASAAALLDQTRGQLSALQAFVLNNQIVSLPFQDLPQVIDTPPFARVLITAAMDPPGPLEPRATDAFYFVTPPDASKPQAEQTKYLQYFNQWFLEDISVHEVMPGHYTQYLYNRAHPSWPLARRVADSYTTTEGWAHYAEQMMREAGLEKGNPKYQAAQAGGAILRDCRLISSIVLHTGQMSLDQVTDMLEHECFQPHALALREARRGTADPGYYSYALGKLMILKLREDVKATEGAGFSLKRFHDRFMNAGLVPVAIIRREITGKDGKML